MPADVDAVSELSQTAAVAKYPAHKTRPAFCCGAAISPPGGWPDGHDYFHEPGALCGDQARISLPLGSAAARSGSRRSMAAGATMLKHARALSLATIDVLEGTPRGLRWTRTKLEREMGWPDELEDAELTRDRSLRLHPVAEQQPPPHA
jgi:hypothetical protein